MAWALSEKKKKAKCEFKGNSRCKTMDLARIFQTSDSANDINVLQSLSLVSKIASGTFLSIVSYPVDQKQKNTCLLFDGVCYTLLIFVPSLHKPVEDKDKNLKVSQNKTEEN